MSEVVETSDPSFAPPEEMSFTMSESSARHGRDIESPLPAPNRRESVHGVVHPAQ